ncbi:pyridoxal-phosphate dependent enzyme [Glycomyces sp. TRM65418]|uniref:PLP-dependent cysteine synthase family protein n=1 Tax=Glycomyces sp. TRM65418 TaxID=2867006 RepID=UPI001CE6A5B2|nr:pyridoxal-phosphate dependent enzyme [Glycomyces sp. TRM65418]MCC3764507.1 pyridoxal-phosphate dependent enzyme [Glycomyces sp. TRM65418]QZD54177.1 pyridoxal-phosphate dependent enzyme [Glycomyces sp. TRM65418]
MTEAAWARGAITALRAEPAPATPLRRAIARFGGAVVHLKDESAHPSGKLKHRLIRDLLLHALASGDLREGATLVEATGGGGALSLGHFANLLGLPFTAVMPARAHPAQVAAIESLGGRCELVDPPLAIYTTAERIAAQDNGFYLDMFNRAEAATDWRTGNIGSELLAQCDTPPGWVVCGAGTGITAATLARHFRYADAPTRVAVADPGHSAYFPGWASGDPGYGTGMPSRVPGIGRPRIEPAFRIDLADRVVPVPDAASIAAMRYLAERTGTRYGPATGTCLWAARQLAARTGATGAMVIVAGEGGERYRDTYYSDAWLAGKGIDTGPWRSVLEESSG